jgi:hypothetical protein
MTVALVEIYRVSIDCDPNIHVFCVEVTTDKGGLWKETIPTEEGVYWFMRGLQAGQQGNSNLYRVEVPDRSSAISLSEYMRMQGQKN